MILQDLPTIQVLAGILSVFFFHLRERKGERNLHEQKYKILKNQEIMEENRHIFALSCCLKTWIERALRKSSFIDVCSANIYKSSKDASIKNGLCHHISLTKQTQFFTEIVGQNRGCLFGCLLQE